MSGVAVRIDNIFNSILDEIPEKHVEYVHFEALPSEKYNISYYDYKNIKHDEIYENKNYLDISLERMYGASQYFPTNLEKSNMREIILLGDYERQTFNASMLKEEIRNSPDQLKEVLLDLAIELIEEVESNQFEPF